MTTDEDSVCSRLDCSEPATKRAQITGRPFNVPDFPVDLKMLMGIVACDPHQTTNPHDLVSDAAWISLETLFHTSGKILPDRTTLGIEWVALDFDPEASATVVTLLRGTMGDDELPEAPAPEPRVH